MFQYRLKDMGNLIQQGLEISFYWYVTYSSPWEEILFVTVLISIRTTLYFGYTVAYYVTSIIAFSLYKFTVI